MVALWSLLMSDLAFILYADHVSQETQLHMASSNPRNHGRKSVEPPSGAEP